MRQPVEDRGIGQTQVDSVRRHDPGQVEPICGQSHAGNVRLHLKLPELVGGAREVRGGAAQGLPGLHQREL